MSLDRFVVVDFETTGNDVYNGDRIIQIGAVLVEKGNITKTFSSFVNPNQPIPSFIEQLTGITDDMVNDAPTFDQLAPSLLSMLDGAFFVAHNVPFDLSFLQTELENSGYEPFHGPTLDTVELSRLLLPMSNSFKLNQLAKELKIEHQRPHQADSDAFVTAELLLYLLKKLEHLPLVTLQKLKPLTKTLKSDVNPIIQHFLSKKSSTALSLSDADHLVVFRQLAMRKITEEPGKDDEFLIQPNDFIKDLTKQNGLLSKQMDRYEVRPGQVQMMHDVMQAFTDHQHALMEAGTGTGKSLAYLIPSILCAKQNEEPVVISTHTVQLQEQLLERDLPVAKQVLPFDFKASLLKGRNHYLCLRKFEQQFMQTQETNPDILFTKGQLLIWLLETKTGDIEELSLPSGGQLFWKDVQSDANSCLNRKCPWFSKCFYHRARKNAQQADIIITNHALLFTDLTSETKLLPNYKEVVIDEAHHMEDVASEHFGVQLDYFGMNLLFSRIGLSDGTGRLHALIKMTEVVEVPSIDEYSQCLDEQLKELMVETNDLFTLIHQFVSQKVRFTKLGRMTYRYHVSREDEAGWQPITECALRVKAILQDVMKSMKTIHKVFKKHEEHMTVEQKGLLVDFDGLISLLEKTKDSLVHLLLQSHDNEVAWIEAAMKGAKNAAFLYSQPIEVKDLLADEFFGKKRSVILTSATLAVNDSFDFMIERLGLTDFGPKTAMIESPFDYSNQVRLCIPSHFPQIKDVSEDAYVDSVVEGLYAIAKVTKGRMLVLFTSYDMLKNTYAKCKQHAINDEFVILGQSVSTSSRQKLTKHFKEFDRAILFGTSSFWEGVDIPGDDLSCVVIVRLPFSPPDNPLFEAQSERIKKEGMSPFMHLSLPQAVIRFKQGFGRLIRTSEDKGVVFVFDRRLVTTRYGKYFIRSLPLLPIKESDLQTLLNETKQFLS